MKLDAYFTAYKKLTQKGSKIKMREPNLKLLEENIGEIIPWHWIWQWFVALTLKTQDNKRKNM